MTTADNRGGFQDRNNNLENSAVIQAEHSDGMVHKDSNGNWKRPLPALEPVEGLVSFGGKVSPVGDIFGRVDPISVFDEEFCCSAASFFRVMAIFQGLPYGNGMQVTNYLIVTYFVVQKC